MVENHHPLLLQAEGIFRLLLYAFSLKADPWGKFPSGLIPELILSTLKLVTAVLRQICSQLPFNSRAGPKGLKEVWWKEHGFRTRDQV